MRVVDPTFAPRLREIRMSRGLSLRQLSRLTYFAAAQISQWENGIRRPTLDNATILDQALEAGGELAALVTETPDDRDAAERIAHAIKAPSLLDAGHVEALATQLAMSRHLDDSFPASALLPAVEGQLATTQILAREARGPVARDVHLVAVQFEQFAGWLNSQVRNDKRAEQQLSTAARDALSLDHPDLACQTLSFRGALDRFRGNAKGITRWNIAAYEVPGVSDLHKVDAAFHAVQGLGMLGDQKEAARLLGEADDITTALDGSDASSPVAYWLSPSWLRMPIGLAHLGLGNHKSAAENLRAGLESMPDGWQNAEWSVEYRDALAQAEAGQIS